MYCYNCGLRLPEQARYCSRCGTRQKSHVNTVDLRQHHEPARRHNDAPVEPELEATQHKSADFYYSYLEETAKFFLLNLITFGLYTPYWAWKRWELIGKYTKPNRIHFEPGFYGFFIAFTSFGLFRRILRAARDAGYPGLYVPSLWGTFLLILLLTEKGLSSAESITAETFFAAWLLIAFLTACVIGPANKAFYFLLNHNLEAR